MYVKYSYITGELILSDQTTAPEIAPLQSQDLIVVLEALQLASSRGAFKIEEFKTIGETYTRLYTFLVASGVITPQQTTDGQSQDSSTQ